MIKRLSNFIFLMILLAFPLGHLLDLPIPGLKLFPNLLDPLLLLFFVLNFKPTHLKNSIFKAFIVLNLTLLFSLLVNFSPSSPQTTLFGLLYLFRLLSASSIFLFLSNHPHSHRRLLFFSSLALISFGFLQYVFLPDTRFLKFLGFDDHFYRFIGTLFDPNFIGAILGCLVILYFDYFPKKPYFLLPLIGLALTFSRGSYLSFFIALLFYGFLKSRRLIIYSLLLLLATIIVSPKPFGEGVNLLRTYSFTSRLTTQTQALNLFTHKPFLGYGFATLKLSLPPSTDLLPDRASRIDNSYLYLLVGGGLLALFAFIYFLRLVFIALLPHPALLSSFLLLLIHSLFNNSFFYLWINLLFWVILSLSLKRKSHSQ